MELERIKSTQFSQHLNPPYDGIRRKRGEITLEISRKILEGAL